MDSNLKIEDLLGELSQEGQLDSSGSFTIEAQAAVQKLSQFQLGDPSAYLVKIVQAAVASGARACSIDIGLLKIDCWFYGADFDPATLGQIPGELLRQATATPARYHLAVALNGAVTSVIAEIEMCCHNGLEGQKVVWKSDDSQTSGWTPPKDLKTSGRLMSIKFQRNDRGCNEASNEFIGKRDIFGMLTGAESGWTRDEKVLQGKFELSPIPLKINGRSVRPGRKTFQNYRSGAVWSASIGELFRDQLAKELYFPGLGSEGPELRGLTVQVPVQTQNPTWVELATKAADSGLLLSISKRIVS